RRRWSVRRPRSRAGRTRPQGRLGPNHPKPNPSQTKKNQGNGLGFSWISSSDFGLFNGLRATQSKYFSTPATADPPRHESPFQNPTALVLKRPEGASKAFPVDAGGRRQRPLEHPSSPFAFAKGASGLGPLRLKQTLSDLLSARPPTLFHVLHPASQGRGRFPGKSLPVGLVLGQNLLVLGQNLVVPQPLGYAVQLGEQFHAVLVVIALGGAGGFLVSVEPVERLQVKRADAEIAPGERLGCELHDPL